MMPQDRQLDAEAMRAIIRDRMTIDASSRPAAQNAEGADAIMRRIHAELEKRGSGGGFLQGAAFGVAGKPYALERWQPAAPRLPIKREYVLAELLSLDDADFVDHAYRTILRRPPDESGYGYFLRELRAGNLSKVEVLGEMRWSAEGLARSVHVDGLLLPYKLHRWRRRKGVGPVIGMLHSLLHLPSLAARQAASDAAHARETQELGRLVNRLSAQLENSLHNMQLSNDEAVQRTVESAVEKVRDEIGVRLDALDGEQAELRRSLERIADEIRPTGPDLDSLYADFEDKFRGSESLVRQRLQPYLDVVREVAGASPETPVIDLGAGRGEWLEMLRESGIKARGVDTNRVFLSLARERGLDMVEADAIDALKNMPDSSASVITAMHLVEHLPFESMICMIDEALRVLRVGGMLILETPNPENLRVASLTFYIDPTHRNPIPPEALSWLVQARGYKNVSLERLSEARELTAPAYLGNDIPAAGVVNTLVSHYHAAPDYAVIAWKQ